MIEDRVANHSSRDCEQMPQVEHWTSYPFDSGQMMQGHPRGV
jgi:hypothetical protein